MDNLNDYDLVKDPLNSFQIWWKQAQKTEPNPDQMCLTTFGENLYPSSRMVLFKGFYSGLFSFFTNYESRKARELASNNKVSLLFWWEHLGRQVQIKGDVKKMSADESEAYFASRARESQIASSVSDQSQVIEDRESLMEKFNQYSEVLQDEPVPYPKSWGGYLVRPHAWEFFLYGEHRLNDRFQFAPTRSGEWKIERLQP